MGEEIDEFWRCFAAELAALGLHGTLSRPRPLSGGCMHAAVRIDIGEQALFVKSGTRDLARVFAAEAEALQALADGGTVRVPRPLACGTVAGRAYLATEFVELGHPGDAAAFGESLACLHAHTANAYGWHRDNWIGSTTQPNDWHTDWVAFWRERRLQHQLNLALQDGHRYLAERGFRLAERLEALLAGHRPPPSLLHGDLWAGNHGYDQQGTGCIFDPATYYGDRETDLAMTELFGGFADAFHAGYRATWPLADGYEVRRELYNLYHVLNHAHLFGGAYGGQAERVIERLLAEIGT